MSLALSSDAARPPQRDSMWLLSPSQVSFQSVAAQQSPYLQHVQHLLQRINRCNNATLITHFCPIRVMRPHFCHNRPCQRTVLAPQDLQDGAAGRRISEVAAFQTFLVKVESQAKRLRQDCRNKATSPHSSLRKGSIIYRLTLSLRRRLAIADRPSI